MQLENMLTNVETQAGALNRFLELLFRTIKALENLADIFFSDAYASILDTESEQYIQASLAELLGGRTSIVIAHRLSTVRRADLILVLDGGRIIEQGTHEVLMDAQGHYAQMVLRQQSSIVL